MNDTFVINFYGLFLLIKSVQLKFQLIPIIMNTSKNGAINDISIYVFFILKFWRNYEQRE